MDNSTLHSGNCINRDSQAAYDTGSVANLQLHFAGAFDVLACIFSATW
jgi:hypothetical protein